MATTPSMQWHMGLSTAGATHPLFYTVSSLHKYTFFVCHSTPKTNSIITSRSKPEDISEYHQPIVNHFRNGKKWQFLRILYTSLRLVSKNLLTSTFTEQWSDYWLINMVKFLSLVSHLSSVLGNEVLHWLISECLHQIEMLSSHSLYWHLVGKGTNAWVFKHQMSSRFYTALYATVAFCTFECILFI